MRIGILGGGQLGRMLAIAGHPLGMNFRVMDPAERCPCTSLAEHIAADYRDDAALDRFAHGLDVVTYEFENVPIEAVTRLATRVPVWPPPEALAVGQDRLREKTLFRDLGIATTRFAPASSLDELVAAVASIGTPCVVKTRRMGYDGKGQAVLPENADSNAIARVWRELAGDSRGSSNPLTTTADLIVEEFVPFDAEASVIAVRSRAGEVRAYPLVRNEHRSGILRHSRAPFHGWSGSAEIGAAGGIADRATESVADILERLSYVGVLAVEFFVHAGRLIANEIAPRVHNTGHWTIEGSACGQFENHLRAIGALPLGATAMRFPGASASMVNLVGGWPDPARILEEPTAHLHLYGKSPRPGRKVGHVTVVAGHAQIDRATRRVQDLADASWA
jgi:5-(carboxyamino)imidazole ribonucleotide synthase